MTAIGLLGGTFDPIHNGHIRLALEIREQLALSEVRLIPAGQPRLRSAPAEDGSRRWKMVVAATENAPLLVPDDRELRRSGPTRTVETLALLRAEYPEVPLCLILGMDAFSRLDQWHAWRELIELAHIAVAARPNSHAPTSPTLLSFIEKHRVPANESLLSQPAGFIHIQPIPLLDISATSIRKRVAAGRSIAGLVPTAVQQLIEEERAYQKKKP